MNTVIANSLFLLSALLLSGCDAHEKRKASAPPPPDPSMMAMAMDGPPVLKINDAFARPVGPLATCHLEIKGMYCMACAETISSVLVNMDGVRMVEVDLKAGRGTVEYDPVVASPEKFLRKIKANDYDAAVASPPRP